MVKYTKKIWDKVRDMHVNYNLMLGHIATDTLLNDPKHLAFTFSRYKFSAKMMRGCKHIIEIGCGEGLGALILRSETSAKITAVDFDNSQIEYATNNIFPHTRNRVNFICHNMISHPYKGEKGDGLVCLDVLEHIHPLDEKKFLQNCINSIKKKSIAIFGTPNKYVRKYASLKSKQGHINLFYPERLASTLKAHFTHVFIFSMNDEMVHTGYDKLAHYLLALCVK